MPTMTDYTIILVRNKTNSILRITDIVADDNRYIVNEWSQQVKEINELKLGGWKVVQILVKNFIFNF